MAIIDLFLVRQFAGAKHILKGEILVISRQNLIAKAVRAEFDVLQTGARHEVHQLRREPARAQKTTPRHFEAEAQECLARLGHMPR